MIVTFQSKASGDVIMFGDVAFRLMQIMGKDAESKGILTVEQLPEAIRRLQTAITENKALRTVDDEAEDEETRVEKGSDGRERPYVSLAQRAAPLLELLEYSLRKRVPVVWGV